MGAISLASLAVALLQLPLEDFLKPVIETYRAIFHGLIAWLSIALPFTIPAWGKDLVVLYGLVGGAVVRRCFAFFLVKDTGLLTALFYLAFGRDVDHVDENGELLRQYRSRTDWWIYAPRWFSGPIIWLFWPLWIGIIFVLPFVRESGSSRDRNKEVGESYFDDRLAFFWSIFLIALAALTLVALETYQPWNR